MVFFNLLLLLLLLVIEKFYLSVTYVTIFPLVGSLNPLMSLTMLCIGYPVPLLLLFWFLGCNSAPDTMNFIIFLFL